MQRFIGLFFLLFFTAALGCQKTEKTVYANVSGTVTYNGQPIDKGQITFALEGRPPSTMDIVAGKFDGQAMVGSNKVSVSAKKKSATGPAIGGGAAGAKDFKTQIEGYTKFRGAPGEFGGPPADYDPTMLEYIPPEWGVESKQVRVIESGAVNELKFDIKGPDKK